MKKLLLILLAVTCAAGAQNRHEREEREHREFRNRQSSNWVAPVIVGGAIAYALTRPRVVVIDETPIVVDQPIQSQGMLIYVNGVLYRKQLINVNGQWQEVLVRQ